MIVEVDRIRPSEFCLRDLDEAVVENLAKSIEEAGLLQPVVVRPLGDGYELVFGLYRLEACERLGWKATPALFRQVSEEEAFLLNVVENSSETSTLTRSLRPGATSSSLKGVGPWFGSPRRL